MKDTILFIFVASVLVCLGALIGIVLTNGEQPLGSIITGQEYYATTTDSGIGIQSDQLIKRGYGSLAQITVTLAGTTAYNLFDATSTDAIFRDSRFSTSSQLLTSIPASLVAGTYVFDVTYNKGLVIDIIVNGTASTTISYR